jgi:hypothetical protein
MMRQNTQNQTTGYVISFKHCSFVQSLLSPIMTQASVNSILSNPALQPQSSSLSDSLASARTAALPAAFNGVDLLLFSAPPPSLALLSPSYPSLTFPLAAQAPPLIEVIKRARPRYMFWAEGEGFWEREPYGWVGTEGKEERWTRAVKLGALGDEGVVAGKKARVGKRYYLWSPLTRLKWFYAFTLPPQTPTTPLPTRPNNATPNPYVLAPTGHAVPDLPESKKRPALEEQGHLWSNGQGVAKKGRTGG